MEGRCIAHMKTAQRDPPDTLRNGGGGGWEMMEGERAPGTPCACMELAQ
jgi:hypothetical protein